jgi:hypothetical protein
MILPDLRTPSFGVAPEENGLGVRAKLTFPFTWKGGRAYAFICQPDTFFSSETGSENFK